LQTCEASETVVGVVGAVVDVVVPPLPGAVVVPVTGAVVVDVPVTLAVVLVDLAVVLVDLAVVVVPAASGKSADASLASAPVSVIGAPVPTEDFWPFPVVVVALGCAFDLPGPVVVVVLPVGVLAVVLVVVAWYGEMMHSTGRKNS